MQAIGPTHSMRYYAHTIFYADPYFDGLMHRLGMALHAHLDNWTFWNSSHDIIVQNNA